MRKNDVGRGKARSRLAIALLLGSMLAGCGGGSPGPNAGSGSGAGSQAGSGPDSNSATLPPEKMTVPRLELAQTLIQASDDKHLLIISGKPLVVRAFLNTNKPPATLKLHVSNQENAAGAEVSMDCSRAAFNYSGPFTLADTGSATPCIATLDQDANGRYWANAGLKLSLASHDADGKVTAKSDDYDLSAAVRPAMVLPLCPRLIVDSKGVKPDIRQVKDVEKLRNTVLNVFPFADIQLCPDAFEDLPVEQLTIKVAPLSTQEKTWQNMDARQGPVAGALNAWRQTSGTPGYVYLGLLPSARGAERNNPPPTEGQYQGAHGVTVTTGGMAMVVSAPAGTGGTSSPAMSDGPINEFQYYFVIAHELGHALGLKHAPGCSAAGSDPDFPYIASAPGPDPESPRGTIGNLEQGGAHGYQLYAASNALSQALAGIAERNAVGYVYNASISQVIGDAPGELPIGSFNSPASPNTQVYDLMNYCSAYYYNKWISDYNYWRVAAITQDRMQVADDGSVTFKEGNTAIATGW